MNSVKHFLCKCSHTCCCSSSQEPRDSSGVREQNSDSAEFPKVSRIFTCKKKNLHVEFLAFLDYPHFKIHKNAMRQNVPQVRMKCATLHQKCTDGTKTPLLVIMVD